MKHLNNYIDHINENLTIKDKIDRFLVDHNITGKIKKIRVLNLMPAQEEIFLDEIVSNLLKRRNFVKKCLKGKLKDDDIIVTSDNYIIDGSHEWATALILNPDCKIKCTKINLPLKEAVETLNNLLKDIKSQKEKKSGELKYNVYNLKNDKIKLKDSLINLISKQSKKEKKFLKLISKKIESDLHPLNYIIKNIYRMPSNDIDIYDRNDMPQLSDREIEEILN